MVSNTRTAAGGRNDKCANAGQNSMGLRKQWPSWLPRFSGKRLFRRYLHPHCYALCALSLGGFDDLLQGVKAAATESG